MIKRYIIFACTVLSGCTSNVQGSWQCPNPVPRGSPCMNISAADGLVNKPDSTQSTQSVNPIARQVNSPDIKADKAKSAQPMPLATNIVTPDLIGPTQKRSVYDYVSKDKVPETTPVNGLEEPEVLTRTPEAVARVWFAPFIDKYNNRHEGSYVYVIDQESAWRMQ